MVTGFFRLWVSTSNKRAARESTDHVITPRCRIFLNTNPTRDEMAEDAVVQDIGDPQTENLPEEMPQTDDSYAEFQEQGDANGADQNISQDTNLQGIELKFGFL